MDTMDVDFRCRLCASVYTLGIDVFGAEGTKMDVKQKISTYLSLEVKEEDTLPKNICYLCLGRIEEFHKFKTMCSETQLTLKHWTTDCLDDEDMAFYAECRFEDREGCTSFLSADSNATAASAENLNGQYVEESSSGNIFSTKKRQKNNGASNKVKTNKCSRLSSRAILICKPAPCRREIGDHSENTTQEIVQHEAFTSDSGEEQEKDKEGEENEEEEAGFQGFVAKRRAGCKLLIDSYGPPLENETMEENNREGEQNEINDPDHLPDDIYRMQSSQTSSESELLSVVKQEPVEESYPEWQCTVCQRIFTRIHNLKEHLKLHPEFSQERAFNEHPPVHHSQRQHAPKTSTPKIRCLQKMTVKQRKKRGKQMTYCCKYCKSKFEEKRRCYDHMRRHFAEKPYTCKVCDLKFAQHRNLVLHRKVHRNGSVFFCAMCMCQYSSKAELSDHMSQSHQDLVIQMLETRTNNG